MRPNTRVSDRALRNCHYKMNRANVAFKLPIDIADRWERSYRHLLGALNRHLYEDEKAGDDRLETLRIADLEITSEAMRAVYRAMVGGPVDDSRFNYLVRTPDAVPAWKKALRMGRAFAGLRESYRPAALIRSDDVCSFHSSPLLRMYARRRKLKPLLMSHGDWFVVAGKASYAKAACFDSEQNELLAAATHGAFLAAGVGEKFDWKTLGKSYERLAKWINFHRQHLARRSKRLPLEFWSGTMGFPLHRIFAQAVSANGGVVVGFDHGSGSGIFESDNQARHELGFVDRFITFAPAMAEGLRLNAQKSGARFSGVDIEPLTELRAVARGTRTQKPIKAVYVGSQYYGNKFISPPFCDNERLMDWQYRLISSLKKTGLKVAIKPHPDDTQEPARKISRELDVEVLKGKFENISWSDTIFFFDTLLSSAFSAALASGMPIVLFDIPHIKRRAPAQTLLERRVAVAPAWYDERTRIQTDWDKVNAVIDRAISLQDEGILQQYYGIAATVRRDTALAS
jgi:hypothetical protein